MPLCFASNISPKAAETLLTGADPKIPPKNRVMNNDAGDWLVAVPILNNARTYIAGKMLHLRPKSSLIGAHNNGPMAKPRMKSDTVSTVTSELILKSAAIISLAGEMIADAFEEARASMPSWKVIQLFRQKGKFFGLDGSPSSQRIMYLALSFASCSSVGWSSCSLLAGFASVDWDPWVGAGILLRLVSGVVSFSGSDNDDVLDTILAKITAHQFHTDRKREFLASFASFLLGGKDDAWILEYSEDLRADKTASLDDILPESMLIIKRKFGTLKREF